MKTIKIVNYSSNIITSIISLIVGVILFSRPDLVTIAISYILGSLLIAYGIGKIIYFSYQKGKNSETSSKPCIAGIILIVIGFVCIFLSGIIEQIIRFVIGAFILLAGVNRIIKVFSIKNKKSSQFIAALIVSLILMAIGIYVILVSNLVFSSLGLILIIYSIIEIINYIIMAGEAEQLNSNPHIQEAEAHEKEEKLIETKEENKKTKKTKKKGKKN